MRIVITFLVLIFFLFSGTVFAIDKQVDKKIPPDKIEKKADSKIKSTASSAQSKSSAVQSRDYNDFVDKNNNGIDDRAEKSKNKSPVSEDNKTEKQPKSSDSVKTDK